MLLIFERQWLHLLGLAVLLPACVWASQMDAVQAGELWGVSSLTWYWTAIAVAIIHQVYVWFCWRMELHGGLLSKALGNAAFPSYAVGFALLGVTRVIAVFALAVANQESLGPSTLGFKLGAILIALPALYLFYSVKRYFGFRRAFGIDHFDPSTRNTPFVRQGIFRFTSNGMYTFGFLLLWAPALWWASTAALIVALFNHIYIWVHYFATERPDMKRIYGP